MIKAHRMGAVWLLGAFLSVSIGLYYYAPGGHNGTLYGADFINVWAGTQLGLSDVSILFDLKRYNEGLIALMGGNFPRHNWSYPPYNLLLYAPFTWLPYGWALAAWSLMGFAAYAFAVWPLITPSSAAPSWRVPWRDAAFFLASPAVIITLFTGQNGLFTAAFTLWALRYMQLRPLRAGISIGALALKPQLGLIWPLMLVRLGAWRTFVAAALTVLALIGIAYLLWGFEVWQRYMSVTAPFQLRFISDPFVGKLYQFMMPTLPMSAAMLGVPFAVSIVAHAIIACGVLFCVWRCVPRATQPTQFLLITTAVLLITPYAFNYDMCALSAVLALHLRHQPQRIMGESALMLAVYFMPAWVILAHHMWWPFAYPLLLLLFVYAVMRAKREVTLMSIIVRSGATQAPAA